MSSFSSITSMVGCKRKSILSKVCRKFIEPNNNLVFGSAFHLTQETGNLEEGLHYLENNLPPEENLDYNKKLLTEMYIRQYEFMQRNGIKMLEHEIPFKIEIQGETKENFVGYIDGLAEYAGDKWLVEFKTARYIDVGHVPIDSQITAYLWACRELNIADVKGVLYIVNKKSLSKPPVVLKSGQLSTAKNQGCSYDDYYKKAIEIYKDEENFPFKVKEFMGWLRNSEQPSIVMVPATRTEKDLDNFGAMVAQYVEEEGRLKKAIKELGVTQVLALTPCFPNKMCYQFCDFKEECKKLMLNEDLDIDEMDEDDYNEIFTSDDADL